MLWTVVDSAESTEALRHPCSRRVHFKITIIVFAADVQLGATKVTSEYTLTRICSLEYMKGVESVFEIIAEPNRRAILSLLVSSQQSVGEIERQLRMPQPTVSKHLRVLREAGFVESTVDAQRRLYVIIYDALVSPVYRYSEEMLMLPLDMVAAVIEVKSRLNKQEIEDGYKKIA